MAKETASRTAGKRCLHYDIEGHGEFVFVQPPRSVYARLTKGIQDDNVDDLAAMGAFIKTCLVSPDADAYEALLETLKQGALPETISIGTPLLRPGSLRVGFALSNNIREH